jgi:hypothetical protein
MLFKVNVTLQNAAHERQTPKNRKAHLIADNSHYLKMYSSFTFQVNLFKGDHSTALDANVNNESAQCAGLKKHRNAKYKGYLF